jgi:hypothetical protein
VDIRERRYTGNGENIIYTLHPENGNCNVYRNVGKSLTFYAAYFRKSKLCIELQPRKPEDKNDRVSSWEPFLWVDPFIIRFLDGTDKRRQDPKATCCGPVRFSGRSLFHGVGLFSTSGFSSAAVRSASCRFNSLYGRVSTNASCQAWQEALLTAEAARGKAA